MSGKKRRRKGIKPWKWLNPFPKWRKRDCDLMAELKAWDRLSDEALRNVLADLDSAKTRIFDLEQRIAALGQWPSLPYVAPRITIPDQGRCTCGTTARCPIHQSTIVY